MSQKKNMRKLKISGSKGTLLFMYIIVYVRRVMLSYMYKLNIKI